ncbi:MAG TPA: hypothetical protein VGD37_22645 [Kofleriaceae bacterium]|jgi:hypothetical protein
MLMVAVCGSAAACGNDVTTTPSVIPPVPPGEVMDVMALEQDGHPAAKDLDAAIHIETPAISRCADPVRAIVRLRRGEIGFGRVGVVVDAIGRQGRELELTAVEVPPIFPPETGFAECVKDALTGKIPVIASADYSVRSRVHLCVQPERP